MRLLRVLGCLALLPLACGEDAVSSPHDDEPTAGADGAAGEPSSQGDAGATGVPAGPQLLGREGGVVTSDDGLATLTIPRGALAESTTIQLRPVDPEDNPALARDATQLAGYELLPDGLVLQEPATLTIRLAELVSADGEEATVPFVLATTFSKQTLEVLTDPGLSIDLDSGDATFEVSLSHFSYAAVESFPPSNKLGTPYFYFRLEPMPPAQAELERDYGMGLHFHVRSTLEQDVGMTYTDESEGLTYSGGTDPVRLGGFVAKLDSPVDELIPAGDYRCDELGKAQYSARLVFDEFLWEPFPLPEYCTAEEPCAVETDPQNYWVRLARDVSCVDATETPSPDQGPYSGYVSFQILHDTDSGLIFEGFFPGADQAGFDAWVAERHAAYGITPDRLPAGTCREIPYQDLDWDLPPDSSQLGTAAQIGLDFVGQGKPLYAADWQGVELVPRYNGYLTFIPEVAPQGLDVYLPIDVAAPAIRLPGWDVDRSSVTWTPAAVENATESLTASWAADTVYADFVHLRATGHAGLGLSGVSYECFADLEDQLVVVPQDIFEDVRSHESWSFQINFAKRVTAPYAGKTLNGIFLRTQGNSYVPPPT